MYTSKNCKEQAKKYDRTPILTFDQPPYWKAKEIQMWESENSSLKDVVLILGSFHRRIRRNCTKRSVTINLCRQYR